MCMRACPTLRMPVSTTHVRALQNFSVQPPLLRTAELSEDAVLCSIRPRFFAHCARCTAFISFATNVSFPVAHRDSFSSPSSARGFSRSSSPRKTLPFFFFFFLWWPLRLCTS